MLDCELGPNFFNEPLCSTQAPSIGATFLTIHFKSIMVHNSLTCYTIYLKLQMSFRALYTWNSIPLIEHIYLEILIKVKL